MPCSRDPHGGATLCVMGSLFPCALDAARPGTCAGRQPKGRRSGAQSWGVALSPTPRPHPGPVLLSLGVWELHPMHSQRAKRPFVPFCPPPPLPNGHVFSIQRTNFCPLGQGVGKEKTLISTADPGGLPFKRSLSSCFICRTENNTCFGKKA